MLEIEVDLHELRAAMTRFLSDLSAGSQRATQQTAEASREHIASGAYWTVRTGKVGKSKVGKSFVVSQDPEALGAVLRSGSKVARFLDAGTKPHTITAKRRDALRFVASGGAVVFRRTVKHPGTKPKQYIAAEAQRAEPALLVAVERAADAAVASSGLD